MKKIYAILLISLFAVGCDSYLDRQPDEPKTSKNIFEKRETTFRYLANVYSWTNNETDNSGQQNYFEPASDECACAFTGRGFRLMNNSTWQVSSAVYASNTYENYYKGIREASYFMANVGRCPELTSAEITEWIAEARFLRAYYYFCLMRQYGPVILLGESTADFTDPALRDLDRNTWDECVDYVCGELDAAAFDLPLEQPAVWYGRATKGAALAVKARLLLYSARPLFNGNPMYASMKNVYGRNLFPTEYDPAKWQLAADAAKEVIDLGVYEIVGENEGKPYESWRKVFIERWNRELIFAVQRTSYNWRVSTIPRAVGGRAYGGVSVTQKLVDAFAMSNGRYPITGYLNDGKPIVDDESGYTESGFASFTHPILGQTKSTFKMYIDREPRFYMSVYWSGLNWIGGTNTLAEIQLYTGGNSGPGIDGTQTNYSITGYLPFKFQDITFDSKSAGSSSSAWIAVTWPLFRYAEILLDYAEAVNNCENRVASEVTSALNRIRRRAGVPDIEEVYPEAVNDAAKMNDLIVRERMIELNFENHRYFDTRTLMIAEKEDAGNVYGMNISARSHAEESDFWKRTVIVHDGGNTPSARVFNMRDYLFPFHQSEVDRLNNLTQNYQW